MTTVFLRPDGTLSTGGWRTESGGTDLHNSLLETSPVDSDYIISGTSDDDSCELTWSNPGGAVVLPTGGVWTILSDNSWYMFSYGGTWSQIDAGAAELSPDQDADVHLTRSVDFYEVLAASIAYESFDTSGVSGSVHTANLRITEDTNSNYIFSGPKTIKCLAYTWGEIVEAEDWIPSSDFSLYDTGAAAEINSYNPNPREFREHEFSSTAGMIGSLNLSGFSQYALVFSDQGTEPVINVDEANIDYLPFDGSPFFPPELFIDSRSDPITKRFRVKKNNGNATINLNLALLDGAEVIKTISLTNISTDWTDVEVELTEAEAASVTDWDDLRLVATKNPA